jgi:hypothetical protein
MRVSWPATVLTHLYGFAIEFSRFWSH